MMLLTKFCVDQTDGGSELRGRLGVPTPALCHVQCAQCAVSSSGQMAPRPAYPAIVRAGDQSPRRDNAPGLAWDGLAAHYAWDIIEWPGRGVNTNTELCGEAVFTNIVLLPSITVCTLPNCEVCPQWCHTVQQRIRADVGQLDSITTPPIIRLAHTGST